MWTRIYLLLLAVRVYFALSPSYIHPDENFQGPEVIAGKPFTSHEGGPWASQPGGSAIGTAGLVAALHAEACLVPQPWRTPPRDCRFLFSLFLPISSPLSEAVRPWLIHCLTSRGSVLLPSPSDMGVHLRPTGAEHLPLMASLWLSHGSTAVDLDRDREGGDRSQSHLLYLTRADVRPELRARGLGNP